MSFTSLARHQFLDYLRENPDDLKQTSIGSMTDADGSVCALGAGCKLFGIRIQFGEDDPDPSGAVSGRLPDAILAGAPFRTGGAAEH